MFSRLLSSNSVVQMSPKFNSNAKGISKTQNVIYFLTIMRVFKAGMTAGKVARSYFSLLKLIFSSGKSTIFLLSDMIKTGLIAMLLIASIATQSQAAMDIQVAKA